MTIVNMIKHKKEEYDYNCNELTGIKYHPKNGKYKEWPNRNSRTEYCNVQIKHFLDRMEESIKKDQWT